MLFLSITYQVEKMDNFYDADWASNIDDKDLLVHIMYSSSIVSYCGTHQSKKFVLRSSTKLEYRVMAGTTFEKP